ncbi:hypothetical protein PIROE2DRAFT_7980 [Piromyces sp. E2]|nr:hypothetical protein PIROE2DRAFT_7980 [Piromyces sp. E2]|eukprot:OUM65090.1 hypothetical protein PIROE2DRAFT_7980 [Piromyces sp. E2]
MKTKIYIDNRKDYYNNYDCLWKVICINNLELVKYLVDYGLPITNLYSTSSVYNNVIFRKDASNHEISKLCTDALVEYFKNYLFHHYGGTDNEEVTNLNSKECRDKNSARGIKIGGSLLLTFDSINFSN